MKNKLVGLLVGALLISGFGSYAKDDVELTLKSFVTLYTANDVEIMAVDQEILIAKEQLKELEESNKKLKKEHSSVDAYLQIVMALEYAPKEKALEIDQLLRKKKALEQRLEIEAQKAFVEYQVLQSDYFELRQRLEKSKAEYQVKLKMVEQGVLASSALKSFQNAILLEEDAYLRAELAYDLKKIAINEKIGRPLEAELTLIGIVNLNVKEVGAYDIEKSESVIKARETLKMAKMKHGLYSARMWRNGTERSELVPYYEWPSDWSGVQKAVSDAEVALSKALKAEALKVRMAYNTLRMAKMDVQVAEIKIEKVQSDYEAAKVRFDLGHLDKIQWEDVQYRLSLEKRTLVKAHQNVYFAYLDFLLATEGTF